MTSPNTIIADMQAEIDALRKENEELILLFAGILNESGERDRNDGNAPFHGHDVPGVWDRDNGKLAGKKCAWCAMWNKAKELRTKISSVKGGV